MNFTQENRKYESILVYENILVRNCKTVRSIEFSIKGIEIKQIKGYKIFALLFEMIKLYLAETKCTFL